MRLHWLCPSLIALALGGLAPPGLAHAQSEVSTTAVLGLEGIDVPTTLTDEMSEQLRQRVSGARDMRLVSGKDLVEVKLVFSCADEAATCMAQAGKSLDAQKLIFGSVKRSGDDYAIWLKMFDVRRAKIEFWLTETLPHKVADSAGVKAASARWFAKLTGRTMTGGTVQVTSNVPGAAVSVDGVPVGATGELPLAVPDVAPGKRELMISKVGHVPVKQQVTVVAGQTVPVSITLRPLTEKMVQPAVAGGPSIQIQDGEAQGGAAAPGKDPSSDTGSGGGDGRGGYRAGFWVTFVAGLASAGAAIKFGLDIKDINKRLDPYRRFPCMGGQLCDSKNVVRQPLTPAEKNSVSALNDEGNRDQTLQWICVGVGSALGIASGYLFYKGYIDTDDERPASQSARHGLRIFPTAGVSSSGIVAEFDF